MKLAQVELDIIGAAKDKELPGTEYIETDNIGSGFGPWLSSIMSFAMLIAAILVLFYLIWGAFEWITSAGDKSKLEKARQKITGAVTGIIVLAAVTAIFMVIQQFLGIQVFTFTGSTASGGGGTGGGGNQQGNCVITGTPVSDGGNGEYCSQGIAMVQCFGPDSHLGYNHYDPCYCQDGSQYQLPGYDFSRC